MMNDTQRRLQQQQIVLDPLTSDLLFTNGKLDAEAGKSWYDGWKEICQQLGWSHYDRTLATERYLDGHYAGRREGVKRYD